MIKNLQMSEYVSHFSDQQYIREDQIQNPRYIYIVTNIETREEEKFVILDEYQYHLAGDGTESISFNDLIVERKSLFKQNYFELTTPFVIETLEVADARKEK